MQEPKSEAYVKAAVNTHNAQAMLADLEQYIARGRVYRDLPEDELAMIFIVGMKEWDRVLHPRPLAFADAEAEYRLRGLKAPYDAVRPEFNRLMARATAAAEAMPNDEKDAFAAEMFDAYDTVQARRN